MRYRPFNHVGLAVSAITLSLDDAPLSHPQRLALVYAALEAGINSFELSSLAPECIAAARAAIDAAGRDVLVLTYRPANVHTSWDGDPTALSVEVGAGVKQMGAHHFDAVLLPFGGQSLQHDAAMLHALRAQGLAEMVGVACGRGGPTLDLLEAGFGVVATPFGLRTDVGLRKRLHTLVGGNMAVMAYDFDDVVSGGAEDMDAPMGWKRWRRRMGRWFMRKPDAKETDPYEFLHRTPDWSAEAIALAYTLTEPALATVRVQTNDVATLSRLAVAVERGLPAGAAAQIEMARFAATA